MLDPDSGKALPHGERAERVVTSCGRGFIPRRIHLFYRSTTVRRRATAT